METPLSSRRITRSQAQALAASNSNMPLSSRKNEESENVVSKSRQRTNGGKQQQQERERSALIDITNDSPIVGLAMGRLETPSSNFSKKRMIIQNSQSKQATTPGSGEALLRGQVKTLLQKVEEEAVLSKISVEDKPLIHGHGRLVNSPMSLLAPTPANTPQVSEFSANNNNGLESFTVSPVVENFNFSQMLNEVINESNQQEEGGETDDKDLITRSLFMDFSEKFEGSDSSDCTSMLTYQGCEKRSTGEDDDASVWSVQVNASTTDEHEDDEEFEEYEENYEDDEDDEEAEEVDEDGDYGGMLDELCEGMSKINVNGSGIATKFAGKHKRFVYNSDGELGEEEELAEEQSSSSLGVLRLKGLPTPKGKHLRFPEESS